MNLHNQPMGQLARDVPGATALFHSLKLNFCCGGEKTLSEAAIEKGLNIDDVEAALTQLCEDKSGAGDVSVLTDEALIEHILERYHDAHREQLPELIRLAQRVERIHGGHPACPAGLSATLGQLDEALEDQMKKEEEILFPMIVRGIRGMAVAPVKVMREHHKEQGDALSAILRQTRNLTLPEDACNTWRALYAGLETLQQDLMAHIHLENNVLFNRIDGKLGAGTAR